MNKGIWKLSIPFGILISLLVIQIVENINIASYEDLLGILIYIIFFIFTFRGVKIMKWIFTLGLLLTPAVLIIIEQIAYPEEASILAILIAALMIVYVFMIHFDSDIKNFILSETNIRNQKEQIYLDRYDKQYNYPTLTRRYASSLIDIVFLIIIFLSIMLLLESVENSQITKIICIGLIMLLYEPIFVSVKCTAGQYITGIRVISSKDPGAKINILHSELRYITKIMLGWLSFLTIMANTRKRAIHDIIGESVVVIRR